MIGPSVVLVVAAAAAVLVCALGEVASMSRRAWSGHPLRFAVRAAVVAAVTAGAAAVLVGVVGAAT